jgi:hypothetical protein
MRSNDPGFFEARWDERLRKVVRQKVPGKPE